MRGFLPERISFLLGIGYCCLSQQSDGGYLFHFLHKVLFAGYTSVIFILRKLHAVTSYSKPWTQSNVGQSGKKD